MLILAILAGVALIGGLTAGILWLSNGVRPNSW